MKKTLLTGFTFLFCLVTILGGCAEKPLSDKEKPEIIRVSYNYRPLNLQALVGHRQMIFEDGYKEDGIVVDWAELENSDIIEKMAAAKIDIATSLDYISAILAKAEGEDLKIVANYTAFPGAIGLVAGSGITGIEQLQGKKVALEAATMNQELLLKALSNQGMAASQVEIVNKSGSDALNSLLQGEVAGAVLSEPLLGQALSDGRFRLISGGEGLTLGQSVIAVRTEFAQKYPGTLRRFLLCAKESRDYLMENSLDGVRLAAVKNEISQEEVIRIMPKFSFQLSISKDFRSRLKETAAFLQSQGFIKPDLNISNLVNDLVDTSFLPLIAK